MVMGERSVAPSVSIERDKVAIWRAEDEACGGDLYG